ncbi:MAG: carboxypeptidase-like regulatory domain-containing protein [Bacteroidales bacterium]|jgi:hypothetical protein|nr:carboxypeptidase-like regulatory domain-containing protein [Bacteroidales bacterium]
MNNKLISLVLLLICFNIAFVQQKHTISGYIKDAYTGEELIEASVFIKELKTGGITNVYGFYSITIPEGKYTLTKE